METIIRRTMTMMKMMSMMVAWMPRTTTPNVLTRTTRRMRRIMENVESSLNMLMTRDVGSCPALV